MSFAETARALAGQAGLLLGWRPDDFWQATPDELETALGALAGVTGGGDAAPIDATLLARLRALHPDHGADGGADG
jgi:hypothetical protein